MSSNTPDNTKRGFKPDKLLLLGEVERTLRATLSTVPSRPTLIGYIESGRLRGARHPFNKYYYVYQSSLDDFIRQFLQTEG